MFYDLKVIFKKSTFFYVLFYIIFKEKHLLHENYIDGGFRIHGTSVKK